MPKAKGIGLAEWTVPFLELSEEARERKAFPLPKRLPALSKEDTTQSTSAFIKGASGNNRLPDKALGIL